MKGNQYDVDGEGDDVLDAIRYARIIATPKVEHSWYGHMIDDFEYDDDDIDVETVVAELDHTDDEVEENKTMTFDNGNRILYDEDVDSIRTNEVVDSEGEPIAHIYLTSDALTSDAEAIANELATVFDIEHNLDIGELVVKRR